MRVRTSVRFEDNSGGTIMCKGLYDLLLLIEETGNVKAASSKMNLSLTKAWALIHGSEKVNDSVLVITEKGGNSRGRSYLSDEAVALIGKYRRALGKIKEAEREITL